MYAYLLYQTIEKCYLHVMEIILVFSARLWDICHYFKLGYVYTMTLREMKSLLHNAEPGITWKLSSCAALCKSRISNWSAILFFHAVFHIVLKIFINFWKKKDPYGNKKPAVWRGKSLSSFHLIFSKSNYLLYFSSIFRILYFLHYLSFMLL